MLGAKLIGNATLIAFDDEPLPWCLNPGSTSRVSTWPEVGCQIFSSI